MVSLDLNLPPLDDVTTSRLSPVGSSSSGARVKRKNPRAVVNGSSVEQLSRAAGLVNHKGGRNSQEASPTQAPTAFKDEVVVDDMHRDCSPNSGGVPLRAGPGVPINSPLQDSHGNQGCSQTPLIPSGVKGSLSSSWIFLGQDLEARGVDLGLERFVSLACAQRTLTRNNTTPELTSEDSIQSSKSCSLLPDLNSLATSDGSEASCGPSSSEHATSAHPTSSPPTPPAGATSATGGTSRSQVPMPPSPDAACTRWSPHQSNTAEASTWEGGSRSSQFQLESKGDAAKSVDSAPTVLDEPGMQANPTALGFVGGIHRRVEETGAPSLVQRLASTIKSLQTKDVATTGQNSTLTVPSGSLVVTKRPRLAAGPHRSAPLAPVTISPGAALCALFRDGSAVRPEVSRSLEPFGAGSAVDHMELTPSQWMLTTASPALKRGWGPPCKGLSVPTRGVVEEGVRRRLHCAAEALERNNMGEFNDLCRQLKPFAKKRGKASERAAFALLQSLMQRAEGTGFDSINKPSAFTIQDLENGRMWYYTATPYCPFGTMTILGMILPLLVGRESVHVINTGELMVPHLPGLISLLAQRGGGASQAASRKVLRRFRYTHVNGSRLSRPRRRDLDMLKGQGRVAQVLSDVAEREGVDFEFQGIDLDEHNMALLDSIERREGDALVAVIGFDLKFFSDDPQLAGGTRQKLLQTFKRLKTDLVASVDEDAALNESTFNARFGAAMDYYWSLFEFHDLVVTHDSRRFMHIFEQQYHGVTMSSAIACEGRERRIRPDTRHQRREFFTRFGFRALPPSMVLLDAQHQLLKSYPEGFGLLQEEDGVCLMWKGAPVLSAHAWSLHRTSPHACLQHM